MGGGIPIRCSSVEIISSYIYIALLYYMYLSFLHVWTCTLQALFSNLIFSLVLSHSIAFRRSLPNALLGTILTRKLSSMEDRGQTTMLGLGLELGSWGLRLEVGNRI